MSELTRFIETSFSTEPLHSEEEEIFRGILEKYFTENIKPYFGGKIDDPANPKDLLYINLPYYWYLDEDNHDRWITKFPRHFNDQNNEPVIEAMYDDLTRYCITKDSKFEYSFTDLACKKLRKTPKYILITYGSKPHRTKDEGVLHIPIPEELYTGIDISGKYIRGADNKMLDLTDLVKVIEKQFKQFNFHDADTDNNHADTEKKDAEKFAKFLIVNKKVFDDLGSIIFIVSKIFTSLGKDENEIDRSFGGVISTFEKDDVFFKQREYFDALWLDLNIKFREWAVWQWSARAKRDLLKHSTKSGVAAIMSRNGSHNLGSHVISDVSNQLNELGDDKILFNYIQERMDYVAQITTEVPGWTITSDFIRQLMRTFYLQRHLLNHISSAEELSAYDYQVRSTIDDKYYGIAKEKAKYEKTGESNLSAEQQIELKSSHNRLIIRVTKSVWDIGKNKLVEQEIIGPDTDVKEGDLPGNIPVAIPGGVIGHHAFYTILENIIRNSAKYNWSDKEKRRDNTNLVITIHVIDDPEKEYVLCQIYDNISDVFDGTSFSSPKEKENQAIQLIVNNPLPESEKGVKENIPLHQKINSIFSTPFINEESGELKNSNWGLAEIKISAGYLNKKEAHEYGLNGKSVLLGWQSDDLEKDKKSKARDGFISTIGRKVSTDKEAPYHLCYQIAIPKPKDVLIVGEVPEGIDRQEAKRNGIIFSEISSGLDFKFVVFTDPNRMTQVEDDIFKYELYPYRVILLSEEDLNIPANDYRRKRYAYVNNTLATYLNDIPNLPNIDGEPYSSLKLKLFKDWLEKDYNLPSDELPHKVFIRHKENVRTGSSDEDECKKFVKKQGYKKLAIYDVLKKAYDEYESKPNLYDTINKVLVEYGVEPDVEPMYDALTNIITEFESDSEKLVIKDALKTVLHKYKIEIDKDPTYLVLKRVLLKYEEDIETLPRKYRGGVSSEEKQQQYKIRKIDPIIKGYVQVVEETDDPQIELKRHFKPHQMLIAENIIYQEALSGSQSYFNAFQTELSDYEQNILLLQIVENALFSILILDERYWNHYRRGESGDQRKAIKVARIHPFASFSYGKRPPKAIGKAIQNDEEKDTSTYLDFNQLMLDNERKYDALIIHQTILDEYFEEQSAMEEFIDNIKKYIPLIVVTSGRGKPDKLPRNANFLPFSNLDKYLIKDYHEKFLLTQALLKLAREKEKE